MFTTISLDSLQTVTGGLNPPVAPPQRQQLRTTPSSPAPTSTSPAPRSAPSHEPTMVGDGCRALYSGVGAAIGAGLQPEVAPLGAIVGGAAGAMLGNRLCQP